MRMLAANWEIEEFVEDLRGDPERIKALAARTDEEELLVKSGQSRQGEGVRAARFILAELEK